MWIYDNSAFFAGLQASNRHHPNSVPPEKSGLERETKPSAEPAWRVGFTVESWCNTAEAKGKPEIRINAAEQVEIE